MSEITDKIESLDARIEAFLDNRLPKWRDSVDMTPGLWTVELQLGGLRYETYQFYEQEIELLGGGYRVYGPIPEDTGS